MNPGRSATNCELMSPQTQPSRRCIRQLLGVAFDEAIYTTEIVCRVRTFGSTQIASINQSLASKCLTHEQESRMFMVLGKED